MSFETCIQELGPDMNTEFSKILGTLLCGSPMTSTLIFILGIAIALVVGVILVKVFFSVVNFSMANSEYQRCYNTVWDIVVEGNMRANAIRPYDRQFARRFDFEQRNTAQKLQTLRGQFSDRVLDKVLDDIQGYH